MTDVATMPLHPQSNGRDERFHRTPQEYVPIEDDDDLYQVRELIQLYRIRYNRIRPRSALRCLRPIDYYRGSLEARLAERERKLQLAAEARKQYWGS